MRIPGIKTGKTASRWLRARIFGGALILGYHRIGLSPDALDESCVAQENFSEHLHEMRRHARPLRLSELVQHLKDGSVPGRSIAITFDDGYADNLYAARPMLEKYEIPATVFVCTGYMGKEFWWDELDRLVTNSASDPHMLDLHVDGKQFGWHKTNASSRAGAPVQRHVFSKALYRWLLSLDVEHQNLAMSSIRRWSGVPSAELTGPRAMSGDELLQLVDGGLIELGAHSQHHPMMPQLSVRRQKEEIEGSKRDLELLLGKKITGFSYPNGRATTDAKRLVQEMGFAYACTSMHDVVRPGSDLYELTRFWQGNVNGDQFVKRLTRWIGIKG